jgi:NADP-dependent 3-hydroxy acid dehydrogenase YdfG
LIEIVSESSHPNMASNMTDFPWRTAPIVGTGPGISASLARGLAALGLKVGLAARGIDKLRTLSAEINATAFAVDASAASAVAALFEDVDHRLGEPDVVVYNASARAHGPIAELDPHAVAQAIAVTDLMASWLPSKRRDE